MRSFDLFDTLVFRFCGRPENVFDFGDPEFRRVRQSVDDRTLDRIYERVGRKLGWDDATRQQMRDREIEAELATLEASALGRTVEPGDLVVSDMYLPREVIEHIVREIAGLRDNPIYCTPNGKRAGYIWKTILADHGKLPSLHTGDSVKADVKKPRKSGVATRHVWGCTEGWGDLDGVDGPVQLRRLSRACRLKSPYDGDSLQAFMYELTCNLTVPMLFKYAAAVAYQVPATKTAVFVARGALYLHAVFVALFPERAARVLRSSRTKCDHPDPAYDAHFDEVMRSEAVLVDDNGTGGSMARYCARRGIATPPMLFMQSSWGHLDGFKADQLEHLNVLPFGSCVGPGGACGPCQYPRGLGSAVATAVFTAIDLAQKHGVVGPSPAWLTTTAVPLDRTMHRRIGYVQGLLHSAAPQSRTDAAVVDEQYWDAIATRTVPTLHIPPCHVISQGGERETAVCDLLASLGATTVYVHRPVPATEATQRRASELCGGARVHVSKGQASHLVTYLGLLDMQDTGPCLILEDDICPMQNVGDTALFMEHACTCATDAAIMLEWCGAPACVCMRSSLIPIPANNRFHCTAAIGYTSAAARRKMRNGILAAGRKHGVLATDKLMARITNRGFIRASIATFFQNDARFGSTIEGSKSLGKSLCKFVPLHRQRNILGLMPYEQGASPVVLPHLHSSSFARGGALRKWTGPCVDPELLIYILVPIGVAIILVAILVPVLLRRRRRRQLRASVPTENFRLPSAK